MALIWLSSGATGCLMLLLRWAYQVSTAANGLSFRLDCLKELRAAELQSVLFDFSK